MDILKNVYYAIAHSHLNYNTIIWGRSVEVNRVFILQKRLIRLMYNIKPLQTCRNTFVTEKIMTLSCLYILKCCVFVFNNRDLFSPNNINHDYNTRNAMNMRAEKHNTSRFEKSPLYSCATIYNKLPVVLKLEGNVKKFKFKLKNHLISKCYYSVSEYLCN